MSSPAHTIRRSAERFAERTALVVMRGPDGDGRHREVASINYGDLYADVLRLCSGLHVAGVRPGDRLAVLLDNSIEMVATEWACLLAGYVWVALNTRSSPEELAAILRDSSPAVVVVDEAHCELLEGAPLPAACIRLETGSGRSYSRFLAAGDCSEPRREPTGEDPVRIRYTSGTAGRPKGAVLARRGYEASVEAVAGVIAPLAADDVLVQAAPMTHAAGAMLLPHAQVGARAVLLDHFEAGSFIDLVAAVKGTAVFLVPTMLVRVLEALEDPARLASLRTIVYGGAAMPVDRLRRGLDLLGPVFVEIYGLTESTWPVTALRREDHVVAGGEPALERRLTSCGRPTSVGELRIVDGRGNDPGPGEAGEIVVRGRNTMLGYWDAEMECAATGSSAGGKGLDADGWMHTGDVAWRDADGFVTIVDRLHDMIVSGGFNVYPREVEEALSSHGAVLEAAVVGRPSEEWGETVHAYVVLRPGAETTAAELIAHCAKHVAGYKKPRSVELADELPRNASGKILRRELRDRLRNTSP